MTAVDRAERFVGNGGHVHLIGIGGIGMAGVAFLLKERGFTVSGCDLQSNRQTVWLSTHGVSISAGHAETHISPSTDWLIRSTAVPDSHPEVRRALEMGIPVSRRGEVLPALMRSRTCIAVSGTHGKTTTTSIIAQLLGCGYCVGGEIDGEAAVARDGELMVVEADESDGTVAGYTPDYAIVTNIEYDHMEHHASETAFVGCFEQLIRNTRKWVFYRADDPIAGPLCASNPICRPFTLPSEPFSISLPGQHNQWNAAAALAVGEQWKSRAELMESLKTLSSVRRRFETVYDSDGVRIISDYAHHPTEVSALIQTAKALKPRRLIGVFQPHRFSRTLALGADFPSSFDGLDHLWLLPVYAASEAPIEGGTTVDLMNRFPEQWQTKLTLLNDLESGWAAIRPMLMPGDLLLIIGAGDIEQLAEWARSMDT
ncbi:MAG: hypothetical protein JXR25_01095 [Pontiellaceae bacterium]|nr:hypothetical protein [Pontiellaceae bacterium]MBN2783395.1 hypothetical protein [Pontiellaceae bacterium]